MNTYSASKFCDMVGVPYSSLRYYERIGLLNPRKDESNNYREYTPYDAFLLNRFKTYRSLGFEVKESLELIKNSDIKRLIFDLDIQQEKIKREILLLQEKNKAIERTKNNIYFAEQGEEIFKVDYMEDKLFLPASKGNDFLATTYEVFSKWVDLLPITDYCKRIKKEDIWKEESISNDYGISIDLRDIELLDNKYLKNAELIKGGKCISFYTTKFSYPYIDKSVINKLDKYIEENNYVIKGDIYMEGVKINNADGKKGNIVKIIIE